MTRAIPLRLVLAVSSVVALLAMTYAATSAYFSGTTTANTTVTTATIGIQKVSGFPLTFTNLLPGETQSQTVVLKNTSTAKADFFSQLHSDGAGSPNFCADGGGKLMVKVENLSQPGIGYNVDICRLYPGWAGSIIPKIADDVPVNADVTVKVSLTLAPSATNAYAGGNNTDQINLIAVQYNGPAPVAQTSAPGNQWPDGDTNYSN